MRIGPVGRGLALPARRDRAIRMRDRLRVSASVVRPARDVVLGDIRLGSVRFIKPSLETINTATAPGLAIDRELRPGNYPFATQLGHMFV
jgi:hypothetical protein